MENNTVQIKDLPRAEEVLPGDLIVIEDEQGSKAIDFRDFVVGPENTSFFNGLATNIASVSTYTLSLCSTVATNIDQTVEAVRSNVANLTASVSKRFPQIFQYSSVQTILLGSEGISFIFYAPVSNITENDFTLNLIPPYARLAARTIGIKVYPPVDISSEIGSPSFQYSVSLSALPVMSIGGGADSTAQAVAVKAIKYY